MNDPPSISLDTLDAERWRRIEKVLDAALEMDPEQIPALLDRVCSGDAELRLQVQQLLDADAGAGGFLSVPAAALAPQLVSQPIAGVAAQDAAADSGGEAAARVPAGIGHYSVMGELGRGGMGVVYLGRDDTRGRTVAIKLLPERFAGEAERLARFRREARLLGSLHHPNIAAIHGLEQSAAGQRYLILERVEGETLAERLRRGALPMREALDVCGQIADALATAHLHGIVHRDLKPSNVMVTASGLVKVLDFGLAKHVAQRDSPPAPGGAAQPPSGASTPPPDVAGAGERLGTPGYMSREQILGLEQDARTDVFAFGCVLFECLTGTRAFTGRTPFAVVSATLSSTVDLERLPAETPAAIRTLLAQALEKDAGPRLPRLDEFVSVCRTFVGGGAHGSFAPPAASASRLPTAATAFIGREREIEACTRLLARARLVTLTGAGGCGKTRLALEVARTLAPREPAGVWFADLAAVSDAAAVAAAVAEAAGVQAASTAELGDVLARAMAGRPGLLVLDSCERMVGPCSALADELLGRCPTLCILATSREWLGASGEQTQRVAPLATPTPDDERRPEHVARVESVRLFVASARAARRDLPLEGSDLALVARICRGLDGIPLALELAAAMLREQSLEQIAQVLEQRLQGRASADDPAAPPDALASAIGWSYEQLSAEERALFRALAVFAGGCSLESAVAVWGDGRDEFGVLDLMTRLVDQSLVAIERAERVEPRYRLLEPIRDFATARAAAERESAALAARHLDHFLELAERAAPELLGGPDQSLWLARIAADHQNLLAAIRTCERSGDGVRALRLGGAMWWLWYVRGHFALGRDALARALALPGAATAGPARALVLYAAGGLAVVQGDFPAARALNSEALGLYRTLGDRLGVARSLTHLGIAAIDEGHDDEARGFYAEAIGIFRELGDVRRLAKTLNNLGVVAMRQDDYPAALGCYEESLVLARGTEDRDGVSLTLVNLGVVATRLGRLEAATQYLREVLALIADIGAQRVGTAALETVGELLLARERAEVAARLLGAAAALRQRIGVPQDVWWRHSQTALTDRLRVRLGADAHRLHWSQGAGWSFEAAVAEAQRALDADVEI